MNSNDCKNYNCLRTYDLILIETESHRLESLSLNYWTEEENAMTNNTLHHYLGQDDPLWSTSLLQLPKAVWYPRFSAWNPREFHSSQRLIIKPFIYSLRLWIYCNCDKIRSLSPCQNFPLWAERASAFSQKNTLCKCKSCRHKGCSQRSAETWRCHHKLHHMYQKTAAYADASHWSLYIIYFAHTGMYNVDIVVCAT